MENFLKFLNLTFPLLQRSLGTKKEQIYLTISTMVISKIYFQVSMKKIGRNMLFQLKENTLKTTKRKILISKKEVSHMNSFILLLISLFLMTTEDLAIRNKSTTRK
jgi:hypothetical protein